METMRIEREDIWGPLHFWADNMNDAQTRIVAERAGLRLPWNEQPDLKKQWAQHFAYLRGETSWTPYR